MCTDRHHSSFIDLTGQRVGALTVLGPVPGPLHKGQQLKWVCRCDCGEEISVYGNKLREAQREGREPACVLCKPQAGRPLGSSVGRPPNKSKKICALCCGLRWQVQGAVCENCGLPYGEEAPLHAVVTQLDSSANGMYSEKKHAAG